MSVHFSSKSIEDSIDIEKCLARNGSYSKPLPLEFEDSIDIEKCLAHIQSTVNS